VCCVPWSSLADVEGVGIYGLGEVVLAALRRGYVSDHRLKDRTVVSGLGRAPGCELGCSGVGLEYLLGGC
jgi:hypothetical protein